MCKSRVFFSEALPPDYELWPEVGWCAELVEGDAPDQGALLRSFTRCLIQSSASLPEGPASKGTLQTCPLLLQRKFLFRDAPYHVLLALRCLTRSAPSGVQPPTTCIKGVQGLRSGIGLFSVRNLQHAPDFAMAGATKLHLMLWAPVGAPLPPAFRPKRLWQLKEPRAGLTVRLQLGGPFPEAGPRSERSGAGASAADDTETSAMSCR